MSGKVTNLRTARKARARAAERAKAGENAVRHGLPKPARERVKSDKDKAVRLIDGHKLDDDKDQP